jgi:hypothetical protein
MPGNTAIPRSTKRRLRLAQIEADQAALRASLLGIQERLRVHDADLEDLEARVSRLELLRLKKRNAVGQGADLRLTGP